MLLASSLAVTPFAALSRPVTGIRKKSFIVTFPGSPKACKENLNAIMQILPHGLALVSDRKASSHAKHYHGHSHKTGGHQCIHHSDTHGQHAGRSVSLDAPGKDKDL